MQIKSAPSAQHLTALAAALAALALSVALGSRLTPLSAPVGPALDQPAEQRTLPVAPAAPDGSAPAPGRSLAGDGEPNGTAPLTPAGGAPIAPADQPAQGPSAGGQVERPGRMIDDMPIDPPVHEPGTGTPRYAGE